MRYWITGIAVTLLLTGCYKKEEIPAEKADAVAVRIGDTLITQEDIAKRLPLLSEKDQAFAQTDIGRQNLIQIITREKLIEADARHNQLDQDPEYKKILADKREQLEKTYNDFAQQLLTQFWYTKQQTDGPINVTEKEIKDYYEKYPYEMTLKQIIVSNAQTADQLLRSLKGNPSLWNSLSHQHNIAPDSLKTFSFMPGEYLPNLEVVAANSPVGKVEGFFKTPQGFHIIMKTNERRLSWAEAQPRIQQVLENQKLDELLDSLKTQYEVIIYDKNE
ncbi:MAG: hypothetical protein J5601_05090 [Elusimicrobiaceae bacterium]|nr:hypothetical protein [Elusimicrobiaceae bacterium]